MSSVQLTVYFTLPVLPSTRAATRTRARRTVCRVRARRRACRCGGRPVSRACGSRNRGVRTNDPRPSSTFRHRFLCARLHWVRNRLFAEQIHQDNTDVYPAAPGARRFVKVESYEARSGKASSDNNWNRLIGAHGVVVHSCGSTFRISATCPRKTGAWSTAVCQTSGQ